MDKDKAIALLRAQLDSACCSIDELVNTTRVLTEHEIETHRCKIELIDDVLELTKDLN